MEFSIFLLAQSASEGAAFVFLAYAAATLNKERAHELYKWMETSLLFFLVN